MPYLSILQLVDCQVRSAHLLGALAVRVVRDAKCGLPAVLPRNRLDTQGLVEKINFI